MPSRNFLMMTSCGGGRVAAPVLPTPLRRVMPTQPARCHGLQHMVECRLRPALSDRPTDRLVRPAVARPPSAAPAEIRPRQTGLHSARLDWTRDRHARIGSRGTLDRLIRSGLSWMSSLIYHWFVFVMSSRFVVTQLISAPSRWCHAGWIAAETGPPPTAGRRRPVVTAAPPEMALVVPRPAFTPPRLQSAEGTWPVTGRRCSPFMARLMAEPAAEDVWRRAQHGRGTPPGCRPVRARRGAVGRVMVAVCPLTPSWAAPGEH